MINAESIYTAERGEAITRLDRLCRLLPYISMFIISITLIHVVLLLGQFVYIIGFGGIIFHNIYGIERFEKLVPILLTSPSLTFFLILLAFRFEYLKREGDAYFEELSDELHGVRTNNDDDINFSSKGAENFSLKARIIMRNYSNCSSLPLIPGRYGPGIIVGFNLILTFIAVFFTSTLI